MNTHRHGWAGDRQDARRSLSISCDDCALQCTAACAECVVTFVLRIGHDLAPAGSGDGLVLDSDEARVLQLFGQAGMVPALKFEATG